MNCKCIKKIEDKNPLEYDPIYRSFFLNDFFGEGSLIISYCPICGKKLPKDLINEHEEELKKFFKNKNYLEIMNIYYLESDKIPKEFKSDEWWKKRNL